MAILRNPILPILYILFAVGLISHAVPALLPLMLLFTPWTLLLSSILLFAPIFKEKNPFFLIWFVLTYTLTFLLEALGVATGKVFGPYHYGDVLGLQLLDVPLIIGINWVFVVLGAIRISASLLKGERPITKLMRALLAALLTTAFDFLLEPAAINLGYWTWHGDGIPLQNYVAWFSISLATALLFQVLAVDVKSKIPVHFFLIQTIFFLMLQILGVRT
jgi:putative membrane protein